MEIKGIDISHWQGYVDFNAVKASGIEFVIIKAGGSDKGFYTDRCFEDNYTRAKAAGLKVGAYYFVGKMFYKAEAGVADAERFSSILKGKQFEFPVFLDLETTDPRFKTEATDAAIAFCETMENHGYFVGIYASDISGFKEKLELERIKQYCHWCARYGSAPKYCTDWVIWQQSSKGNVPGISGYVDVDLAETDLSKVITEKGFNGFPKKPKKKKEVTKDGI